MREVTDRPNMANNFQWWASCMQAMVYFSTK